MLVLVLPVILHLHSRGNQLSINPSHALTPRRQRATRRRSTRGDTLASALFISSRLTALLLFPVVLTVPYVNEWGMGW